MNLFVQIEDSFVKIHVKEDIQSFIRKPYNYLFDILMAFNIALRAPDSSMVCTSVSGFYLFIYLFKINGNTENLISSFTSIWLFSEDRHWLELKASISIF